MNDEVRGIEGIEENRPAAAKKPAARGRKKTVRAVPQGCLYIQASYNNTLVTATDRQGNALAWSSAGHLGFRGPKKSTPYAASMVIKDLAAKTKPYGLHEVQVFVRGIGSGRESALRALNAQGFAVFSIKDVTPIPHNGCRAPRPRRV
jgi:small subunit ribosomal protein S11